ncbi:uncharacterized protein UTRI_05322 [Ustilago trichophora]|uniref:Non-structural maintenance of chromosomes element 1 homolog n=1 Tax=Ustilago trichophora TaxID=86804 RepID=A0A5C3EKU2_9BASI|nr:uncharacterized protein UTRI_05322 [Ustilago trichophora]
MERNQRILARVSWLQSLVSHRILPVTFAKHLYQRCCSVVQIPYDESAYRAMYDETSQHLSLLDLEMRQFRDQQSGQLVLALVNTKHDLLIQGATRYSPVEISFIKKLVEEIFKARREAYAIPSLEAVRLGTKLRTHMTRDATEELLKNLVDHKWIDYSEQGIYTLSTRSLLELRNYLQNEFGDDYYHTCTHCKDLVTLGIGCSATSRGCTVRYHLHCARSTIASRVDDDDALYRLAGLNCPGCMRGWKSRPIGPKALNLSSGGDEGLFSSQGDYSQAETSTRTTRRSRRHVSENDDDEEEEEEEEEEVEEDGDGEAISQQLAQQQSDVHENQEAEEEEQTQRRFTRIKPEPPQPSQSMRKTRRHDPDPETSSEQSEQEQDVKPRKRAR